MGQKQAEEQVSIKCEFPFVGIGNFERAMLEGCWPHEAVNVLDIRRCLLLALERTHGKGGASIRDFHDMQPAD